MKLAKAISCARPRSGSALTCSLAKARPDASEIRLPPRSARSRSQLGMTRETLSRVLPALSPHGLRVAGDRLFVDDLAAAARPSLTTR